jgi:hypothetical protein
MAHRHQRLFRPFPSPEQKTGVAHHQERHAAVGLARDEAADESETEFSLCQGAQGFGVKIRR